MKILFIAPDLPYPLTNGARIRIYALIKNLAARHGVSLISFDRNPEDRTRVEALKEICDDVVVVPLSERQLHQNKRKYQLLSLFSNVSYQYLSSYSTVMQEAIDQHLCASHYDVIQVEFAQMGYYKLPEQARRILDQHNVENEILYRTYRAETFSIRKLYSFVEWQKFRRDEIKICRKFPVCLTTSERDKAVLDASSAATRFSVITNGVDSSYFQNDSDVLSDDKMLLFTGTINYYPNTDGLIYFIANILPLIRQQIADVKLYIAGKNPPPEIQRYARDPEIVITGFVEDMRDYFKRATVAVVPLRVGGGTRLKILEAMAMCTPVVATSIGAEGIEAVDGESILIADEPALFAQAVVTLLRDSALRARLAVKGRQLVEKQYDWHSITKRLENTYESLF